MREFDEYFICKIKAYCPSSDILEIGCGERSRLSSIAKSAQSIICIDPDRQLIQKAQAADHPPNLQYLEGRAEHLPWPDETFDAVIFSLSFHHVPIAHMDTAIGEAVRVTRPNGKIIFIEPLTGSMVSKAMIRFDFWDGDERKELAMAYYCMLNAQIMEEIAEFRERMIVAFDSYSDFIQYSPVRNDLEAELKQFLEYHDYQLIEECRMNVFSKPPNRQGITN